MKIANIVSTRPQYVKLAPIAPQLSRVDISVVNAIPGHYDETMSNVFRKNFASNGESKAVRGTHHLIQLGDMMTKIGQWLRLKSRNMCCFW